MNFITILGMSAAICTTASFLPQALKTIRTRNTKGISLYMYALFAFGTLLWFVYGILSQNIPIVAANGITLVFSLIILAYKIRYK
jgi:MtN3 and saliva related transmembrane protein